VRPARGFCFPRRSYVSRTRNVSRVPGKTSAPPPVSQPWCGAAARSRGADQRARAARPCATPRDSARLRGGGPPRCGVTERDGVRRRGGWETIRGSRSRPWCTSAKSDDRSHKRRARSAGGRHPLQGASCTACRSTGSPRCSRCRCGRRLAPLSLLRRDRLVHRTPLGDPLIYTCEAGGPGPWHTTT
jgi:hypothetical protein